MTFRAFFIRGILIVLIVSALFAAFNAWWNAYGLFGDVRGERFKIWHNERMTKYLFSFNYIPSNFEGILMGASISANLDVKKMAGYSVYNISLGGANVTELKTIADNIVEKGHLKFMIICLYPYMTKDHGLRAYIDPKEYWGALGSRENLNVFINRRLIEAGFRPDYFDEYGYFNFNLGRRHDEIIPRDQKKRRTGPDSFYRIDPVAFEELSHLIEKCRSKGIRIVAYYYPIYIESLDAPAFRAYKEKIGSLFRKEDVVWDCNTEEYLPFRMDRGNYNPTYHLSDRGAQFVLEDIQRKLDRHLGRGDRARPGDRSEKNLQRVDA